jgi:hypothetical protein
MDKEGKSCDQFAGIEVSSRVTGKMMPTLTKKAGMYLYRNSSILLS